MTTAKQQQRRGYATQLMTVITDWGRSQGATKIYLQVKTANQPGMKLYNQLGFSEVYQYFYRIKS